MLWQSQELRERSSLDLNGFRSQNAGDDVVSLHPKAKPKEHAHTHTHTRGKLELV